MPETTYVKINVVAPMNKGVVEVTSIRDYIRAHSGYQVDPHTSPKWEVMPDGSTKRFRDQELAIYTFLVRTKIVAHVKQEGYRVIDVLPAGDAHAFLVAVYKDPRVDPLDRKDAAKAALPYEKSRPVTVTLANQGAEPLKVRSELFSVQHGIPPAALL